MREMTVLKPYLPVTFASFKKGKRKTPCWNALTFHTFLFLAMCLICFLSFIFQPKSIKKELSKKILHPQSRKAIQLTKQTKK